MNPEVARIADALRAMVESRRPTLVSVIQFDADGSVTGINWQATAAVIPQLHELLGEPHNRQIIPADGVARAAQIGSESVVLYTEDES